MQIRLQHFLMVEGMRVIVGSLLVLMGIDLKNLIFMNIPICLGPNLIFSKVILLKESIQHTMLKEGNI